MFSPIRRTYIRTLWKTYEDTKSTISYPHFSCIRPDILVTVSYLNVTCRDESRACLNWPEQSINSTDRSANNRLIIKNSLFNTLVGTFVLIHLLVWRLFLLTRVDGSCALPLSARRIARSCPNQKSSLRDPASSWFNYRKTWLATIIGQKCWLIVSLILVYTFLHDRNG